MLACKHPILCLRSGVVLHAPLRTGLTEFLVVDLQSEMRNRGWLTVYVDLAHDGSGSGKAAQEQILDAIDDTLCHQFGRWRTLFRRIGKASIASSDRAIAHGVTSLADRVQDLVSLSGKPVALLINGADNLMQTESGRHAAFGIKVARDALCNRDGPPGLPLVLAGSSREGLAELEAREDSPFFCIYVDRFG